jgi:hypothetical protein
MDSNNGITGQTTLPQWSQGNELLHFLATSNELLKDDFRSESYDYISKIASSFHI